LPVSAFDLIEKQLTNNTESRVANSALGLVEKQLNLNTQEQMKRDLNKMLHKYNIKDGSLVETRRLDLRAAQNLTTSQVRKSAEKASNSNPVEAFLSMKIDSKFKASNEISTNKRPKIRFLNDTHSDSGSDESEDEGEDDGKDHAFGIQLYRQQKMNALKQVQS
jgi:hypothetical protein